MHYEINILLWRVKLNNMDVFILEHDGFWLGGVVVVIEENLKEARKRIDFELVGHGVNQQDYDLRKVKLIKTDKPKTVYVYNGDY